MRKRETEREAEAQPKKVQLSLPSFLKNWNQIKQV